MLSSIITRDNSKEHPDFDTLALNILRDLNSIICLTQSLFFPFFLSEIKSCRITTENNL